PDGAREGRGRARRPGPPRAEERGHPGRDGHGRAGRLPAGRRRGGRADLRAPGDRLDDPQRHLPARLPGGPGGGAARRRRVRRREPAGRRALRLARPPDPIRMTPGIAAVLRYLRRRPLAALGLALVGAFVVGALAAPLVAPYDPVSQPARRLLAPGGPHLLGTDEFGRDVLSRIVYGARVSLEVGCVSVGLALVLGGGLGLLSGYYVGLVDRLAGRLVDVMFAFPSVILIVAIAGVVGPTLATAMLAIGLVYSPIFARIVRGPTLAVMQQQYV